MTISGVYRIYSDGILISEQSNVITTTGKRMALDIMAGRAVPLNQLIIGAGATAATVSDETLVDPYEVADVIFSTPLFDGASSKIIYKARLPETLTCEIYELGSTNAGGSRPSIFSFDSSHVYNISPSFVTTNSRFGPDSARIAAADTLTCSESISIPSVAATDAIVLSGAFNTPTNTNTVSLSFTDYSGLSVSANYGFANSSAYQIVSNTISSFSGAAGFNWNSIASVTVDVTTSAFTSMDVDFISLKSKAFSGKLFSRSVYGTPVSKRAGARMDIEYEIGWNLS